MWSEWLVHGDTRLASRSQNGDGKLNIPSFREEGRGILEAACCTWVEV